jgi:MSHA biogenesis protein MshG
MDLKAPTLRKLVDSDAASDWAWRRTTKWQRMALLRLIAAAVEERLPLAPLLAAWADDERGIQRQRVRRVANLIDGGASLADALEAVPGVLRDEDVLAIRFGSQSGTLAASIRAAVADIDESPVEKASGVRGMAALYALIAVIMVLIIAFLQIKIFPVFQAIFDDFDLSPPAPLGWATWLASRAVEFWWLAALAALALAWSAFSLRPKRFVRNRLLGRRLRPLRELRSAEVLEKLGVAAAAGRPIPGALSTLARYHFDPVTRYKLLEVRNDVEQGADAWLSLSEAALITPADAAAIDAAGYAGNRAWTLRQLAEAKKRSAAKYVRRSRDLLLPVVVLSLGAVVLLQALAVFTPLVELIWGLVG